MFSEGVDSSWGFSNTKGGWQSLPTADDGDATRILSEPALSLNESLVSYPRPGVDPIPIAKSTVQIQVVAPATLPEGFEFDALLADGKSIKVKVPAGGIEVGQTFTVDIESIKPGATSSSGGTALSGNVHAGTAAGVSIPVGHWRDDMCNCFQYGICHPHCWTGFLFPLLAVGQVMTRLELNWLAIPAANVRETSNAFTILSIITLVHFASIAILYVTVISLDPNDYSNPPPLGFYIKPTGFELFIIRLYNALKWSYFIVVGIWIYRVRTAVRAKYAIPGTSICDCLLSFFCHCCAATQLLRHTTDYDIYPSSVFTTTGLPPASLQSSGQRPIPLAKVV